jgi:hypothetical protein
MEDKGFVDYVVRTSEMTVFRNRLKVVAAQ